MKTLRVLFFAVALMAMAGCSISTLPLSADQREADMRWIFNTFQTEYAPLEYKKQKYGIDFEALQKDCIKQARDIPTDKRTNDNYRVVVMSCVSKFKDAHTAPAQMGSVLPDKTIVAYLGFKTTRAKHSGAEALFITDLLPTVDEASFPVKSKSYITKIDGKSVADVLKEEIVPYRDLGQDESNLTMAAEVFPIRNALKTKLPEATEVNLTLDHEGDITEVKLPWVKKDLYVFMKEQDQALKDKNKGDDEDSKSKVSIAERYINGRSTLFGRNLHFTGKEDVLANCGQNKDEDSINCIRDFTDFWNMFIPLWIVSTYNSARMTSHELLTSSFQYFDYDPALEVVKNLSIKASDKKESDTGDRDLPAYAMRIPNDNFLAYTTQVKTATHPDGVQVGYIRLSSFAINEDKAQSFLTILETFKRNGIKNVVLDLLDNGGGSLLQGMELLTGLTENSIDYPKMQVRLNTNWLDAFKNQTLVGTNDSEKEWAKRVSDVLMSDVTQGKKLSTPIESREISRFIGEGAKKSLAKDTRVVVLVNEMCASMCDIFAAAVKDNNLGIIAGTKTMGAGGNVTMHFGAPSGLTLRQTESLILRKDGTYLENNGVEPDVKMDTVGQAFTKYSLVIEKAMALAAQDDVKNNGIKEITGLYSKPQWSE